MITLLSLIMGEAVQGLQSKMLMACIMQRHNFSSGGYCLHKVTVAGSNRVFSAWFNPLGVLIDAEARDRQGHVRPVLPMNAKRQCDYLQRNYGYTTQTPKGIKA